MRCRIKRLTILYSLLNYFRVCFNLGILFYYSNVKDSVRKKSYLILTLVTWVTNDL